jgi:pilus assembly protein FimV
MVYSPSQLDAAGDVDPVAEADVYLAYGRDLQAEEILKEAMRTTPQRVAIHSKLLEIYSKRRDAKAFELVATQAYALTQGEGTDWQHICELGRELDSSNSLYSPGGQPVDGANTPGTATNYTATTVAMPAAPPAASDLDLDLDFSIGDDEPAAPPAPKPPRSTPEPTVTLNVEEEVVVPSLPDMEFDATEVAMKPVAPSLPELPALGPEPISQAAPDENSLNFDIEAVAPAVASTAAAPVAQAAPVADSGMIEFDLGALSLELDTPPAAPAAPAKVSADDEDEAVSTASASLISGGFEVTGGDPLATKLALAQEFNAIGDPDGARSLAEEVLAEASGDLKSQAQRFLSEIS